jgi:predicted RNA-binding Zn ribbon-like protein
MAARGPARDALRFEGDAPWLDLLATRGYPFGDDPAERLAGPERLAAFLAAVGLAPARAVTDTDAGDARALREALRAVALAVVVDAAPPRAAFDAVRAWADRDAGPLALQRAPRLRRRAPRDAGEALGRLARSALEDLTGPRAAQVHACADPDCRKLFLDASGRRRWCSAATCGNRARVRALRERRAGRA